MRSRYTAYVVGNIDHILGTHQVKADEEVDREATEKFSKESEWTGLEIKATERGGEGDEDGVVEFVASYRAGGAAHAHHERATFRKIDGRWLFIDGKPVKPPPARKVATPGRNEPCSCGSGKKYKRCHGLNA